MKESIELFGVNDGDIVLDFFSGSAADAVIQKNAKDNYHRTFIMLQIAETCNVKSEAYKAGFKTICEIGEERIRRAGQRVKDENPVTAAQLDTGFRVFRLDDSNMNDVYYAASDYTQDLLSMLKSNVKPDRSGSPFRMSA